MSPVEAVRKFCVECVGGFNPDVHNCGGHNVKGGCGPDHVCWFYKNRLGVGRVSVKTIRKFCLYCMGDSVDFVRDCWAEECPLHSFRFGTNPNISDETREKRRETAKRLDLISHAVTGLRS